MTSANKAVWAIFGVFFSESVVLGNWIPRIPDIKDKLGIDDSTLGLCLLAIPAGTIIAFLIASKLLTYFGLRGACKVWLPIWAMIFILPGMVSQVSLLFLVLLAAGFAIGVCEVAMNSKADMIEQTYKLRIMSRCHGFWSLGSMVGALIGSAFAHFDWTVQHHYLLIMPLIAVFGFVVSSRLPEDEVAESIAPEAPTFRLPSKSILLLCLMPVGIMMVEGAFIDWSALFMREVLAASPLVIGLTYSFFSLVMTIMRLSGDFLAEQFGELRIVRLSNLAAMAGITVFAIAPNTEVAMLGAALSGLGVAIVYPLSISVAARRPGSVTDNVAAMSLVAFIAFLVAPPIIGFVSDAFGLRVALLLLVPFTVMSVVLSSEIAKNR